MSDTTSPTTRAIAGIKLLRRLFAHHANTGTTGSALAQELAHIVAQLDFRAKRQDRAQSEPEQVPFDAIPLPVAPHPVTQHFLPKPQSHTNDIPTPDTLFNTFQPLLQSLPWRYGYTPRADVPGLENRMAWAELVGPVAPWRSDKLCLGLTAISPQTRYPEHAHPAVEVYYVLSGNALWTADGVTHTRPPGSFILHPSGTIHVMETRAEALLAVYTWSGDVHSPSVYA
jgi:mannose-6-phosphate isomerase-like protein (cupin superfamily)